MFDMLVDSDGNYLLGGHTTVGTGVVNWDYLALKVDSQTRQEVWRRTYGQPRGFDAQWIHDEMYGVAQAGGIFCNDFQLKCSVLNNYFLFRIPAKY